MSTRLELSLAISEYDHVRDLTSGRITPEGIDLTCISLPIEEIFYRAIKHEEFDVCELSMGKHIAFTSQGNSPFYGIPVFPSRVFRHSSIYVLRDGAVDSAAGLKGKKVGVPEWAQTAAVYTRGLLVHEYGIALEDIDWYQSGVNQAGREEKTRLALPSGVRLTRVRDRSLTEMLLSGELDAVMSAHAPEAFERDDPRVVRLFPDYQPLEEAYYRKTGIFPIMHVVAIKRDILDRNPWAARNLLKAFEEARARSIERALESTASRFPIPWGFYYAERAERTFGADLFPYGIEANRRTLEAFARFADEQGVAHRRIAIEELFFPTMQGAYSV